MQVSNRMCVSTMQGDPRKYQTYLQTRPKSFEAEAVRMLIDVLRKTREQPTKPGFVLLIVHLANADLLQEIKQAQDEGKSTISGSVCQSLMEENMRHHAVRLTLQCCKTRSTVHCFIQFNLTLRCYVLVWVRVPTGATAMIYYGTHDAVIRCLQQNMCQQASNQVTFHSPSCHSPSCQVLTLCNKAVT